MRPVNMLEDLQNMIREKQERLDEVRNKLQKTNEEREAIRIRLNEVSRQMEEITNDILNVQNQSSDVESLEYKPPLYEKKMLETVYEEDFDLKKSNTSGEVSKEFTEVKNEDLAEGAGTEDAAVVVAENVEHEDLASGTNKADGDTDADDEDKHHRTLSTAAARSTAQDLLRLLSFKPSTDESSDTSSAKTKLQPDNDTKDETSKNEPSEEKTDKLSQKSTERKTHISIVKHKS